MRLSVLLTSHLLSVQILGSAGPHPLAVSCSQSGKRRRQRLELLEHDNPRPLKLVSQNSARRPEVVADLLVTAHPSSGAIVDVKVHDHDPAGTFSCSRGFSSRPTPAEAPRAFRLPVAPTYVGEFSVCRLPPASNVFAGLHRTFIAWSGGSCCPDGLRGSAPSPYSLSSQFRSISGPSRIGLVLSVSPPF